MANKKKEDKKLTEDQAIKKIQSLKKLFPWVELRSII